MGKRKKINRRKFIQNSGMSVFGMSNLGMLSSLIVDGIMNKAIAQTSGMNKMYLYLQQYGAPPRWTWDLPLTPDGQTSKFISTDYIGNKFNGSSRNDKIEYGTKLLNGLHMPWMWGYDVATPSGFSPMSNLMDGMMIIRGANSTNPGHAVAARLHYVPLGSNHSVSALSADVSSAPIAGVNLGASKFEFRSRKGLSANSYGGTSDLIEKFLSPFETESLGSFDAEQAKILTALQDSMGALSSISKRNSQLAEVIENSTKSAMDFFGNDFGNLKTLYRDLNNKYRDLVWRSINPNRRLQGMSDKPLGSSNVSSRGIEYNYGNGITRQADMRDFFYNSTNMHTTAAKFAFAEFALTNGLTSSICAGIPPLGGLNTNGANRGQFYDEHSGGAFVSTYVNMMYNLGLSSCLLELIGQLKAKGLYENTVIDVGGEFGRKPRGDGSGSDHSAEATSNLIFSGAIEGSHVIGNIVGNNGGRPGTWGYQGVNPTYGLLNVGHVGASIASLLGAQSPVTAVPSLMELKSNGKFKPKLPTGTIV